MLTLKLSGDLTLKQQIDVLRMPKRARVRHHRYVAKTVIRRAKENVKQQRDINGRSFAPRKRGNKPVLRKMPSKLKAFIGANKATVTFPKNRTGQIARAHQEGITTTMTAAKAAQAARRRGEPDYDADATAAQAKALIKEGYRQPVGKFKGGKKKGTAKSRRVSQRWIMENMTVGQAGLILRLLREKKETQQQWDIPLPQREFFGLNKADVQDITNHLINDILNDVRKAA